MCKVRDMICHAHVNKPMNRKVYWDLSCVCVKIDVLGAIKKYGVCACNKTSFDQICACNNFSAFGDHWVIGNLKGVMCAPLHMLACG